MTTEVRDRLRQLTEAQKDAALTAVLDLADELERDSAEAMTRSNDARQRGNREAHGINLRHARVTAQAAMEIRAVVAAAGDQP